MNGDAGILDDVVQVGRDEGVVAVMVQHPQSLVEQLWDLGFDATTHSSLAAVVNSSDVVLENGEIDSLEYDLPATRQIMNHMVFLPVDWPIPDRELDRLLVGRRAGNRLNRTGGRQSRGQQELSGRHDAVRGAPVARRPPEAVLLAVPQLRGVDAATALLR